MQIVSFVVPEAKRKNPFLVGLEDGFLDHAGGFTVIPCQGYWRDGFGRTLIEANALYHIAFPECLPSDDWRAILTKLRKELGEEALYVEIDGKAEILR